MPPRSKQLVSLFFILLCAFSCSRFRNKEEKKLPNFEVYVPLEEDYPLLARGIFGMLESAFPKAIIKLKEGLSDKYEIAPFEEWLTKVDHDGILRLQIEVDRLDDLAPVLTFLRKEEAKIPFKVKIPKPEVEAMEGRGETLFCKLRIEGQDLYSRQVCRELQTALCGKELRAPTKKTLILGPSCQLRLFSPVEELAEQAKGRAKSKLFFLTGFPLPLRVKNDYPLSRFGESEESILLSLFNDSVSDLEIEE